MTCFKPEAFCVKEQATAIYTATLRDQDSDPIPAGSLTTLTLTLYAKSNPTEFINNRDAQDVLNTNGVTVGGDGLLTWEITPADNEILGTSAEELHVALFIYTWNGGARQHWHEVHLKVQNQAVLV